MLSAYKYRLYPTKDQALQLDRTMRATRVVYNWGLYLMKEDELAYKYFVEHHVNPFLVKYDSTARYPKISTNLRLKFTIYLLDKIFAGNPEWRRLYSSFDREKRYGGTVFIQGARMITYLVENGKDDILREFHHAVISSDDALIQSKELLSDVWVPERYSTFDLSRELTLLKKTAQYRWLKDTVSTSLIFALRNLDTAFKNFFERLKKAAPGVEYGYPKFKPRWHRQSMQFHQGYDIDFEKGILNIPKTDSLRFNPHRLFNSKLLDQVTTIFDLTEWFPKTSIIERTKLTLYFLDKLYSSRAEYQEVKHRCLNIADNGEESTKRENNILSWTIDNHQSNDVTEFHSLIKEALLKCEGINLQPWKSILKFKTDPNIPWISEVERFPLTLATFGKTKTVTISRTPSGRYFVSIVLDSVATCGQRAEVLGETAKILGVDHGIRHFITTSDGKQWDRFHVDPKLIKRLRLEQRRLSRKKLQSVSRDKQRIKKARLDERIVDKRAGFIDKVSQELIKYCVEMGYDTLVFRKYDIQKMMRKPKPVTGEGQVSKKGKPIYEKNGRSLKKELNKKITNVAWSLFIEKVKVQAAKHNITVHDSLSAVDTSRKCSHCDHTAKENIRGPRFFCQACGYEADVDFNAAVNTREDYTRTVTS